MRCLQRLQLMSSESKTDFLLQNKENIKKHISIQAFRDCFNTVFASIPEHWMPANK